MQKIALFSLLLLHHSLLAQQYIWSTDTVVQSEPNYAVNKYQDILRYHDPFMYLVYPAITPIVQRKIPLAEGEGKKGYMVEGQFAYRFVIFKGKYYSYPSLQKLRITFDVDLLLRLTRDNNSYPILPYNDKFGIGIDYLWTKTDKLSSDKCTQAWTTLQVHHYSNGEYDSSLINSPVRRNNYRSGDFSTNYFRVLMNTGSQSWQHSILSASLGYQREMDFGGPFTRSQDLRDYYGFDRLLLALQWASKPSLVVMTHQNRAAKKMEKVKVEKRWQVTLRTEMEYIAGDLSRFEGARKYRTGWHTYLTFMPSITNDVGLIAHTYLGRDYLNIRFDDVVFIAEAGVYVKFNSR